MATGLLDPLAAQLGTGHDQGMADPNSPGDAGTSRSPGGQRSEIALAFPDGGIEDARVRWEHHCGVPSLRPNIATCPKNLGREEYRTTNVNQCQTSRRLPLRFRTMPT